MAAYEVLLLNTAIPQIQAAQSGDTYLCPRELAVVVNSATDAVRITQTGTGNALLVEDAANPDSTPFVVTAAGDVGIGTNTPGQKLTVINNVAIVGANSDTLTNGAYLYLRGDNTLGSGEGAIAQINANYGLDIWGYSGGWQKNLTLTASGNLGLGVTPSAWGSAYRVMEYGVAGGNYGEVWGSSNSDGGANSYGQVGIANNVSQGTKYAGNGAASAYLQSGSRHAWFTAASGTAGNAISFTQAMTLDASGNLGIGTTSLTDRLNIVGAAATTLLASSTTTNQAYHKVANAGGNMYFGINNSANSFFAAAAYAGIVWHDGAYPIVFGTSNTERARITSGGYFKASNDGTYRDPAGTFHEIKQTADTSDGLFVQATNASYSGYALAITANRNTTNNSFYALGYYNDGATAYRFRVADSGDVTNTNGTYGTISDAKMKTDIVDAGSQWSDIKALRFRKFKMKDDPDQRVQLGVVAQEVELTSPGLVDEHTDRDQEGNDLGTTTKSVKTSVLLMKAAVALQEAMARIETLEAEMAALKGA